MNAYSCIAKKCQACPLLMSIPSSFLKPSLKFWYSVAGFYKLIRCGVLGLHFPVKSIHGLLLLFFIISHLITDVHAPFPTPLKDGQPSALGIMSHLNPPCGNSHIPCTLGMTSPLSLPITQITLLVFRTPLGFDRDILPLVPPPQHFAF